MTKFSDIKGFAFDLDGVITDTAKFHTIAWHQVADKVGSPWTDDLAQSLKGIDRMTSLEMILKAGGQENDYSDAQKEELAKEKNDNYVKLISKLTQDDILPGMKDFINSLVENGYKMSLASVSRNAPAILKSLKLDHVFLGIVDPATLSKGKPDPEIYTLAAKIMDLPPEQVIGVEDAAAGVTAINGAHEISLGIGDAKILNEVDVLFPSTAEVTLAAIKAQMDA